MKLLWAVIISKNSSFGSFSKLLMPFVVLYMKKISMLHRFSNIGDYGHLPMLVLLAKSQLQFVTSFIIFISWI